tara:strand:+ start:120 stop:635 length:516 start_codon:yes stop_codon:yes gene_type:complete
MWNAGEELIYIGISKSAIVRLSEHQQTKEWATEIHNITLEYFGSRESCKLAETKAIKSEKPKYNIAHNQQYFEPQYNFNTPFQIPKEDLKGFNDPREEHFESFRIIMLYFYERYGEFDGSCPNHPFNYIDSEEWDTLRIWVTGDIQQRRRWVERTLYKRNDDIRDMRDLRR